MKYKSTIIYLIAAIILVGVYLYETRTEEKKMEKDKAARLLFNIRPGDLKTITLKKEKETIKLERSGVTGEQTWRITAPVNADSENYMTGRIRDTLTEMRYLQVVAEETDDMTQFGLHKPVFTVSYTTNKGQGALYFGFRSSIEDGFYVRKGKEKKVYIVSTRDKAALDRPLYDLRDKSLFKLETEKINRMVIDRESGKWILLKEKGKWVFKDDKKFKTDREGVESIIRRITWAEASSFEKESPKDLSPYGLDTPRARIILSDGKKSEEILLGDDVKKDKNERIYARMSDNPWIVTVEKKLLKDLPGTRDELKAKEKEKKN